MSGPGGVLREDPLVRALHVGAHPRPLDVLMPFLYLPQRSSILATAKQMDTSPEKKVNTFEDKKFHTSDLACRPNMRMPVSVNTEKTEWS